MDEPEIDPLFVSACLRIKYDEKPPEEVFSHVVDAGEESLFQNHHIEIQEEDIIESSMEFSSGEFSEPHEAEHDYVIADFYEEQDNDLHIHPYFFMENIDQVTSFLSTVHEFIEKVEVSYIQFDVYVDRDTSELGFTHKSFDRLSLDGVKYTYDSKSFSVYSGEEGSTIRAGFPESQGFIQAEKFGGFVREKLAEVEDSIRTISS